MSIFSRMGPLSRKQVAAKTHIKLNSWCRVQNKTHGLHFILRRPPKKPGGTGGLVCFLVGALASVSSSFCKIAQGWDQILQGGR